MKDNLAAVGNSAVKRAEYAKLFEPILKSSGYAFNANGLPVECIVRSLPQQKGYLIYLGNWSGDKAAKPVLSLPTPRGKFKIEIYSASTKALSDATAPNLERLVVPLAPGEVKLIRIILK